LKFSQELEVLIIKDIV